MCGLVGMAGDLRKEDRDMFRSLLIVDAIRGHHSTGVASATEKGRTMLFKKAIPPSDFIQMRRYDDVTSWDSQVLIGHNRWATVGKIDNVSAHPFEIGSVIGAHNGTLTGWYNLPDAREFDVDSECLIHNIHKHGWVNTMKKVNGAYALTVYDSHEHVLHLIRNKERPLYVATRADGNVVYWASEAWMLRSMASRHGVKLAGDVWQPKEHVLFSWKLPSQKHGKLSAPLKEELEVYQEKKYTPPSYPAQSGGSRQHGGFVSSVNGNRDGLAASLGAKMNEMVEFCPVDVRKSPASNTFYLEGTMIEEPWSTVRSYMSKGAADQFIKEGFLLSGTVAGMSPGDNQAPDGYLVMTGVDTVYEEDETEVIETYVPGPGNKLIPLLEFNELTKHGCGFCAQDLDADDDITWEGDSPLCEDCKDMGAKLANDIVELNKKRKKQ